MVDTTRITKGPKAADYFQSNAFPDKTSGTGHTIAVFKDSGDPFGNWPCHMPEQYQTGKDMLLDFYWFSVSVTTGNIRLKAEVERLEADAAGNSLTADTFGSANAVTAQVQTALARLRKSTITIPRVDMASINPGDAFRIKITRNTTDAADTMVGNMLNLFWSMRQV